MILAANSNQRAIAIAIVFAVLVAWAIYLVLENRRSGSEIVKSFMDAPNRKTPPEDEVFEGRRLDRFLVAALIGISFLAVALPYYWIREPDRMNGAIIGFDKRDVKRGMENYEVTFQCLNCHGPEGGGGVAKFLVKDYDEKGAVKKDADGKDVLKSVQWKAPRINNIALRYKPQQITNILNYGRGGAKNNPMPAWGTVGGGPGSPQQISDLVALLTKWSIESDPVAKEAFEENYKKTHDSKKAYEFAFAAAAKAAQAESQKNLDSEKKNAADLLAKLGTDKDPVKLAEDELAKAKAADDVVAVKKAEEGLVEAKKNVENAQATAKASDGELLFNANCARCHTSGWSYGEPKASGGGFYGPALKEASLKIQFPDAAKQAEFIKLGVAEGAAYGTGGVNHWAGGGMPYFGNILTDDMINKIVAYERGLK